MVNFEQMPLSKEIKRALKGLDYKTPTEVQEKTIPLIMKGTNVISKSFTGSGKTAAFGIAIAERMLQGRAKSVLILCPTRELATQVGKEISSIIKFTGFKLVTVYGGHKISTELRELDRGVDILCATPGRLLDHFKRRAIDPRIFDTVVLDEADRMLDMGFISDLKEILAFVRPEYTHLFSATLDGSVAQLIQKYIPEYKEVIIEDEILGKNIIEKTITVSRNSKLRELIAIIKNAGEGRVLVFVSTKRYADKLNFELKDQGFKSTSIHGGKTQKGREISLKNFKLGRKNILIATDVAARGLQVDNVEFVVNFDRPNDADTYKHRVGRTGRMGATGHAITFMPEDAESRELWFDSMKSRRAMPMGRGGRGGYGTRGSSGGRGSYGGGSRGPSRGTGSRGPSSRGPSSRGPSSRSFASRSGGRSPSRNSGDRSSSRGPNSRGSGGRSSSRGHREAEHRGFHGSSSTRKRKPRKNSDVSDFVYRS